MSETESTNLTVEIPERMGELVTTISNALVTDIHVIDVERKMNTLVITCSSLRNALDAVEYLFPWGIKKFSLATQEMSND